MLYKQLCVAQCGNKWIGGTEKSPTDRVEYCIDFVRNWWSCLLALCLDLVWRCVCSPLLVPDYVYLCVSGVLLDNKECCLLSHFAADSVNEINEINEINETNFTVKCSSCSNTDEYNYENQHQLHLWGEQRRRTMLCQPFSTDFSIMMKCKWMRTAWHPMPEVIIPGKSKPLQKIRNFRRLSSLITTY